MIKSDIALEFLTSASEAEVKNFIREILAFPDIITQSIRRHHVEGDKKEHYRFDMSGYDSDGRGSCTVNNLEILNKFAFLGIYDYTHYLFLDFYKGDVRLYFKYWNGHDDFEFDLSGYGTTRIIYYVFKATILSSKPTRRRS